MKPRANIYPEATEGRVKTSDTPLPEEQKIISRNVDGSKEYEDFKERARENELDTISHRFFGLSIFFVVAIVALAFSNAVYGWYLPYIKYILGAVAGIFLLIVIVFLIRQFRLRHASKKYKKQRKKNS